MAGETLHEERSILKPEQLDRHRAIATLMEELEAIDWYEQRIQASENKELRSVLSHNRDEEIEHASMLLEWLRRHDDGFNLQLDKYLFTEGPIRETPSPEQSKKAATGGGLSGFAAHSLGIGSLR